MLSTAGAIGFCLMTVLTLIAVFKIFPGASGVLTLIVVFVMYSIGGTASILAQCFILVLITLVHGLGGFCWMLLAVGAMGIGKI